MLNRWRQKGACGLMVQKRSSSERANRSQVIDIAIVRPLRGRVFLSSVNRKQPPKASLCSVACGTFAAFGDGRLRFATQNLRCHTFDTPSAFLPAHLQSIFFCQFLLTLFLRVMPLSPFFAKDHVWQPQKQSLTTPKAVFCGPKTYVSDCKKRPYHCPKYNAFALTGRKTHISLTPKAFLLRQAAKPSGLGPCAFAPTGRVFKIRFKILLTFCLFERVNRGCRK